MLDSLFGYTVHWVMNKWDFCIKISILKGNFDILYTEIMTSKQTFGIFSFQSQFSRSKINLIFSKMIFLYEYQIRRTTFTSNIFYFNHFQKRLVSKNAPNFYRLAIISVYKIWKYRFDIVWFFLGFIQTFINRKGYM